MSEAPFYCGLLLLLGVGVGGGGGREGCIAPAVSGRTEWLLFIFVK